MEKTKSDPNTEQLKEETPTKKNKVETEEGTIVSKSVDQQLSEQDAKKVREVVELWFADTNLAFDTFLMNEISKSADGWVNVDTLCTFNAIKEITQNRIAVSNALKQSQIITVNEEGTQVKRTAKIPESFDHVLNRTVYIKGLPQNEDDAPTWQEIKSYFEKEDKGTIELVKLRYWTDPKDKQKIKHRKPSVFLLFQSQDDASKSVTGLSWKGKDLLTMWLKDYYNQKKEEAKKKMLKPKKGEKKKKKENDKKGKSEKSKTTREVKDISGCMVSFDGIGTDDDLKISTFKNELTRYGTVSYVDWESGAKTGILRFDDPEHVENLLNCYQEDELEIGGGRPSFKKLEGEEEQKYIEAYQKKMIDFKPKFETKRGRGKKSGRGRGKRH